jgi:hypothetical protein
LAPCVLFLGVAALRVNMLGPNAGILRRES